MVASSETIDQVVSTFQRAAEANHGTPARQGNVVVLTEQSADDLMVTADLHGHRLNFNKLCAVADLDAHPRRHLVMQEVCHGGPLYPSGVGCMSHLLLEDMARMKVRYPERFHFLLSNHELAELTDFPITKASRVLNLVFRCGLQEMYGAATDRVRKAALRFIASCPLAVRWADRVFICHSVPDEVEREGFDTSIFERPLEPQDFSPHGPVFRLVWGRDHRAENADAFARLVHADVLIHGHEPCASGFDVPNNRQIVLDCCGQHPCYLILPAGEDLQHAELVQRIQKLA